MTPRIEHLRARLDALHLPAMLVTKRENIYYLSGFTGSAGALLITPDEQYICTDFRYFLQVEAQAPAWTLVKVERTLDATLKELFARLGVPRIGVEMDNLSVARFQDLGGADATAPYTLVPVARVVEALRLVKEPGEIATMRQAVRLTDEAYAHLLTLVRPGITERELALEAEWYMRTHGADGLAFDIIVAAGARSALPHAEPGDRPLAPGDLVVVDMGARYNHYCADMTRSFAVAEASDEARKIYAVTLQAHLTGLADIRPGMTGYDADALVRTVIAEAGYGMYFGHGTGHGVGLEIHEAPRVSFTSEEELPAGTVITVEPGIYLPNVGGVRIEDLGVLTDAGVTPLTAAPKPSELPVYG